MMGGARLLLCFAALWLLPAPSASTCRGKTKNLPLIRPFQPRPLPLLQLSQARLQARGREHARVSAELAQARRELERYGGLPADEDAARAATQQKRAELGRLRARLQEQLDTMA